jgi:diketogulonate reductase-like aldo/keto reductase
MELRELGGTGVQIPEIGLGTWQYRGGVAPLLRGIELGAWLIDTAEIYGTEPVVGEAMRGQRDRVFLASKVSGAHLAYDMVHRACEASLHRMGVATIDLYQIHWPNPSFPLEDTMRAMEELVDAGKIRFIGVSNFSREDLELAQACLKRHRIVANQVRYSPLDREIEEDLPFYEANHITVLAYSPFAHGEIFSRAQHPALDALRATARETGKTVAQVALAWCLSRPAVIALPKTDRTERVDELCATSGWRLTDEQVATLDRAFA